MEALRYYTFFSSAENKKRHSFKCPKLTLNGLGKNGQISFSATCTLSSVITPK